MRAPGTGTPVPAKRESPIISKCYHLRMKLRPIRTDAEYRAALNEASAYFENEPELGTPDAQRFERLIKLIEAYEEDLILEGMIDQMNKTTARSSEAIDRALAIVEESNQRALKIHEMS